MSAQSRRIPSYARAGESSFQAAVVEDEAGGSVGNAELASRLFGKAAPSEDSDTLDFAAMANESLVQTCSPDYFATASTGDQLRMLAIGNSTQVSAMLEMVSGRVAKSLVRPEMPRAMQLQIMVAKPGIVATFEPEWMTGFLLGGADAGPIVKYLSNNQILGLANAEDGSHPALARLMAFADGHVLDEVLHVLPYEDCIEILLSVSRHGLTAIADVMQGWTRDTVAGYLDAAARMEPHTVFDELEALLRDRMGFQSEVEYWYQQREGRQ